MVRCYGPTTTYRRKPTICSICLEPHAAFCKAFCGGLVQGLSLPLSASFLLQLCFLLTSLPAPLTRWPSPFDLASVPPNVTCVAWAREFECCLHPTKYFPCYRGCTKSGAAKAVASLSQACSSASTLNRLKIKIICKRGTRKNNFHYLKR